MTEVLIMTIKHVLVVIALVVAAVLVCGIVSLQLLLVLFC